MKAKTLLELITLSGSLYQLSQNEALMNKLKTMAEAGKERVNNAVSQPVVDEEGNELEFVDKIIHKAGEVKIELEQKIEEAVAEFYTKVKIAHVDDIQGLKSRLEEQDKLIALLEARINKLEAK